MSSTPSSPSTIMLCPSHQRNCLSRVARKPGPNKGKIFFACPVDECDFIQWKTSKRKKENNI